VTEMLLQQVEVRSASLSSAIVCLELSKQSCLIGKRHESAPECVLLGGSAKITPRMANAGEETKF